MAGLFVAETPSLNMAQARANAMRFAIDANGAQTSGARRCRSRGCLPAAFSAVRNSRWMVSLPATMLPLSEHGVAAIEIGDEAAGFAHQEEARGDVPG